MRWPHSNRLITACIEPLLLYWLVFGQLLLLYHLLAINPATPSNALLLTGVPLLILLLNHTVRHTGMRGLHMSLLMVVLAHIGILLGSVVDFGPQGLLILAGLCGSLTDLSPQCLWSIVSTAPWTFVGMLLGSNLGMLLSRRILTRDSDTTLRDVVMYPICNIGMLAGMVVIEMLVPTTWFTTDPRTGVMVMLLMMLLGMGMGMLLSWWLIDRVSTLFSVQRLISHGVTP